MSATLRKNDHTVSAAGWRAHAGGVALPTIGLMTGIVALEVVVWSTVLAGILPIGWGTLLATIGAYMAFTVMHEASHGNIDGGDTKYSALEDLFGWLSGAILFAPYSAFRVLHLMHHAHTNDPEKDPDHWVAGKNALSVIARCWTIMPYYYADFLFGDSSKTTAGKNGKVATIIGLLSFVALFVALCVSGFGREAALLWLLPAFLASGFLAFAFDWLPHYPHALQERFRDTRVLLLPGATLPLLWQNYHLIHHLHPRVPFYRYAMCFRDIRPQLEAEAPRSRESEPPA